MNYSLPLAKPVVGNRAALISAVTATAVACCAILIFFSRDVAAALSIWRTSSAYSYGFLILPISLYLIYARRSDLMLIGPDPSSLGAAIFGACLGIWWLGMAASITEVRQFAIVGMIQAIVLTLWGLRLYRRILFPMLYLFLMVPTATVLLGPLQTVTTGLSSDLLRLTGIPVLGANHFIEVPHGLYEVAPGCAGLNFLLSTLALSSLYAVLVFRGWAKRLFGVALALALSIATNAVRVFGIIWLAEATDRRIDIVDDHLLYGWGVYCAVMLAAMIFGLRFRDVPPASPPRGTKDTEMQPHTSRLLFAALALILLAAGIRTSYAAIAPTIVGDGNIRLDLPTSVGAWTRIEAMSAFPPALPGQSDRTVRLAYDKAGAHIDGLIAYDWRQRESYKIVDIADAFGENGKWAIEGQGRRVVLLGETSVVVATLHLSQGKKRRLLWSYDWIGGRRVANALSARLLGMGSAIGLDGRSAMIVLSAADDDGRAQDALTNFMSTAQPLEQALADASLGNP